MKTLKQWEVFVGSLDTGQIMQDAGYSKKDYFNVVKLKDVLELIDEVNNEVHLQPLTELKARIQG